MDVCDCDDGGLTRYKAQIAPHEVFCGPAVPLYVFLVAISRKCSEVTNMKLLSIILLLLTSLLITTEARPKTSRIKKPGHSFGNPVRREYAKRAFDNSTCSDAIAMKTVTAPRKNVFAALDTEEAVEVLSFLHAQSWLNLTAWENATRLVSHCRFRRWSCDVDNSNRN